MNTKLIEKNWSDLKAKIKAKWSKFSDEEIESAKADMNQLSEKIQRIYGIAKDQAEQQYQEFKSSIASLIEDTPVVTPVLSIPASGSNAVKPAVKVG